MILIKQGLLEPVAQDHVQMASEYLKDRLSISAWWPSQKNRAVPDVQMEPPRFQLMPTASVLSLGTGWRVFVFFTPSLQILKHFSKTSHSTFSSPGQTAVSLSSRDRSSHPFISFFIIFTALYWTLSRMSQCLWHWEAQNWTQQVWPQQGCVGGNSQPSAYWQYFVRIRQEPLTFFTARTCCWLISDSVSTRTSRPFSAKLLPCWGAPSRYWCRGLLLPSCKTWHFSWMKLLSSPQAISQACWDPSGRQYGPLAYHPLLPALSYQQTCCVPSPRSAMKLLNRTGPSSDPGGTAPVTGLQLDFALQSTLSLGPTIFSFHPSVHPFHTSTAFLWGPCGSKGWTKISG